ncbi:bile acid:sodium symporter family protein [Gephyromycinifex aptenodytis]|uniref:bile acid:sodium symporter family protein n=1 Tax=Gephyromycinifex aptenodytis TaxID=2716227 RepID=UPI001446FA1C|nr:bile acid:sodium symporter family protein [Gephyromycinifex aptenodytis]
MSWMRRLDGFLLAILAAVLVATVLPATGAAVPALDWVVKGAIFVLFFMYGGRLEPREALAGLKHWRLHGVILAFTYVLFPLLGLALGLVAPYVMSDALYLGLLFVCLVPSTVQSSITFTSIARGNVAGAIVSASLSNLLGVFLTPLLVIVLMTSAGRVSIQASSVLDIVAQILLPFVLGQLSRPLTANWLAANKGWLKFVDRGVIVLVVYSAFSAGMREDIWHQVSLGGILVVTLMSAFLLAVLLWLTGVAGRRLGFNRPDQIAIQFCGTKKSLATGLPMAIVLFPNLPVGLVVLPLMIFHQMQLVVCAALAQRYGRQSEAASA